jgi:predicted RNA binding protein YcfA (HicA-like mRNA interferase family)
VTRLPRATGKDTLKALQRAGFAVVRTRGSHHYLYNRDKDILVTVPVHAGRTLAPKTLLSILKQAGLTPEQLAELL